MNLRALIGAGPAFLLAACATVGPDYHLPASAKINAPEARQAFQGAGHPSLTEGEAPDEWWQLYADEQLNHLIKETLVANSSLRLAAANLAHAEAVAAKADSAREIEAAASADFARARVSGESFLLERTIPVLNLGDAGIRIGYQVDLVGGLKRALEAADADTEASRAALDLARISIVADTAYAYMELCAAGHELEVTRKSLDILQKQQEVVAQLVASGRRMTVDTSHARYLIEQSRATLPIYAARQKIALYKLAVLTGRPPGEYPRQLEHCQQLPVLKQPIPVGDGALLLRRRPDVRQAERTLAGATARIGVATSALYPSISLGFSAGATGLLEHMGKSPTQRWSLGPLISWTFPGDGATARIRQADANAAAALAHFDTVVLNALQETESSLAMLARDQNRETALRQARDAAAEARRQVQALYRAGRLPYLDDLDAERQLATAEIALADASARTATDQIRLFLALGGGWRSMLAPVNNGN